MGFAKTARARRQKSLAILLKDSEGESCYPRVPGSSPNPDADPLPRPERELHQLREENRLLREKLAHHEQSEEVLRESARRFHELAENIGEIFYNYDVINDRLLYASRAFERIWGLPLQQVLDTPQSYLKSVHPEDLPAAEGAFKRQLEGQETNVEFRVCRPDGGVRWVHEHAVPLRGQSGRLERIVGTMQDITEFKLLEQQFLRVQRMESLGTLASGIAHDLNNALTPILLSIDILRVQEREAERLQLLDAIAGSAQRGADVVRQVLYFADGVEGRTQDIQPGELLAGLENRLRETLPTELHLRLEVADGLWQMRGDPGQLQQMLLNLCLNARDAMPAGGRLTLSARNQVLDEFHATPQFQAEPGPYVVLEVSDTGAGMTPEVMAKAFDPFFTTKDPGQGTGLGLATVLAILQRHRGFARVRSEPGAGSTFSLHLPAQRQVAPPAPATPPAAARRGPPRGQGELILVVEDEDTLRTLAQRMLELFGYRVLTAANGAEAIDLFAEHGPEVAAVFTDMMMPVMDGDATIRVLLAGAPATRVIATSGLDAESMETKALAAGARCFLPKPYTAEPLLRTLREVLEAP